MVGGRFAFCHFRKNYPARPRLCARRCDRGGAGSRSGRSTSAHGLSPAQPARRRHRRFPGPSRRTDGSSARASLPTWAGVNILDVFEPALERPDLRRQREQLRRDRRDDLGRSGRLSRISFSSRRLGVGGAIVSRGRVLTGVAGAGGEFGHMTIDPQRRPLPLRQSRLPRIDGEPQSRSRRRLPPVRSRRRVEELVALARAGDVGCAPSDRRHRGSRRTRPRHDRRDPQSGPVIVGGRGGVRRATCFMEPLTASYERHTLIKRQDVPESQRVKIDHRALHRQRFAYGRGGAGAATPWPPRVRLQGPRALRPRAVK